MPYTCNSLFQTDHRASYSSAIHVSEPDCLSNGRFAVFFANPFRVLLREARNMALIKGFLHVDEEEPISNGVGSCKEGEIMSFFKQKMHFTRWYCRHSARDAKDGRVPS